MLGQKQRLRVIHNRLVEHGSSTMRRIETKQDAILKKMDDQAKINEVILQRLLALENRQRQQQTTGGRRRRGGLR
jgi:hypothetical protein